MIIQLYDVDNNLEFEVQILTDERGAQINRCGIVTYLGVDYYVVPDPFGNRNIFRQAIKFVISSEHDTITPFFH